MTRLIDADALKEQIESHVVSMSVCMSMDEHYGKVTMREECLQDIADATTIDAIPVAWLEDKLNATAVTNPDLNNAIFYTLVAWEQQKQNHEQEAR